MSAVVYKTRCQNWSPTALRVLLEETDLLIEPIQNDDQQFFSL